MNSPRLRLGLEASERQNEHLLWGQTKRRRIYFCTFTHHIYHLVKLTSLRLMFMSLCQMRITSISCLG